MVSKVTNRSNPNLRPKTPSFKRRASSSTVSFPSTTMAGNINHNDIVVPNPHETTKPLTSLNLNHCVKLNPLNYTAWRFQLTNILFGFSLLGFVTGTDQPPTETITDANNVQQPNPSFLTWLKQDGLILGALMGTLSTALQPLIVRAKTAKEAWDILASTYANPSRAHIMQLKERFDSITKTTEQTVSDYMNSIKVCVDQLALMGKILDPEDIIAQVLKGLDYETFKPVITTVRARDTPITFEALHEKLLQQELLLKHDNSTTQTHFSPSANPAYRHTHNHRGNSRPQTTPNFQSTNIYHQPATTYHQPNSQYQQNQSAPRPFKGRCQWCREVGHVIANCSLFRRLFPNITFPEPNYRQPQAPPQAHVANYGTSSYAPAVPTNQSFANPAPNPNFLFDSGASHHLTHDLDTLAFHSPYDGLDDLIIGDGSALQIANTGPSNPENAPSGPSNQGSV